MAVLDPPASIADDAVNRRFVLPLVLVTAETVGGFRLRWFSGHNSLASRRHRGAGDGDRFAGDFQAAAGEQGF